MNSIRDHKESHQPNYFYSRMEKNKQVSNTIQVNHFEHEL